MKSRHHIAFALTLLLFVLATGKAAGQTYTAIDLGALRGGSARVHAINARHEAVGASGFPHGTLTHAFFWNAGRFMHDLGTLPGGDYSAAFGINDLGQVVGVSNTGGSMRAFLWSQSAGLLDLGALPGATASQAYAINNAGQVVGQSGGHAVLWNGGQIFDLGVLPGGDWAEAHDINNLGEVVGYSTAQDGQQHAFLWRAGAMRDLGTLPDDVSSRADHVNDLGVVVGSSRGSGGERAFIWSSAGGMKALEMLGGSTYSEAYGINRLGQVVGACGTSLGTRAFLWSGATGTIDLNTVVAGMPGLVLTGAFAINDNGEIVAFGIVRHGLSPHQEATSDSHIHSGPTHVFLLVPTASSSNVLAEQKRSRGEKPTHRADR